VAEVVQPELVSEVSRQLVQEIAPEEILIFRAVSEAYMKDPSKVESQGGKDEMLGFGVGEAVVYLTPYILATTGAVVQFLVVEVQKALKTESSGFISDVVKKMFKLVHKDGQPKQEGSAEVVLTPEQLARVREIAFEQARQLKVSETKAGLLADSLVGRLTTPT
jgi:hypothetical protein